MSTHEVGIETAMELSDLITSLRELSVDDLLAKGLSVEGTFDEIDDPILVGPDGLPVETWREGYPYATRMSRHDYDIAKRLLQIELLKAQTWLGGDRWAPGRVVRRARRGGQGWHHQAVHGALEPARRTGGRPVRTVGA